MKRPKPWLDPHSGSSPLERSLLEEAKALEPPPQAQAQVWSALAAKLGPGPGQGPSDAGPADPGTSSGALSGAAGASTSAGLGAVGLAKWVLVGASSAGLLLGGQQVLSSRTQPSPAPSASVVMMEAPVPTASAWTEPAPTAQPSASQVQPAPMALPSVAAVSEKPEELSPEPQMQEPLPEPSAAPAEPAPLEQRAKVAEERAHQLREENLLLAQARQALRQGNASAALGFLASAQSRYPQAILGQEREALSIEALWALGHRQLAAQRAEAFLKAYPGSAHAARLRAYAPAPVQH